jgi:galactose mutarotase-like enzyme
MIRIQNDSFSASIAPNGAELRSLKNRQTGEEFIWQADPGIWAKSAPVLFPITGLLKDGKTSINGVEYRIPKHGFARDRLFDVLEQQGARVLFGLSEDAESRKVYPYDFTLQVGFELHANRLAVNYTVFNESPGEMLFSIGSHPAFALDLDEAPLSDYSLEFSEPESLDLYGLTDDFLAKKQEGYLNKETRIPLSERTFADDALMFKNIRSREIKLCRANSIPAIRSSFRADYRRVMVWSNERS